MNRRSFLVSLLAPALAPLLPVPKFVWDNTRYDVLPFSNHVAWIHPAQYDYYKALANLAVANPSQNMYFDKIEIPSGY